MADIEAGSGRDSLLIEFNDNLPRMGLGRAARTRTLYTPDCRLTLYAGEDWGELYDTRTDPRHVRNLWDDPDHAALKAEMLLRLGEALTFNMDESPRALKRAVTKALLEAVGHGVARLFVDGQLVLQRRHGALVAVMTLADAAGDADRREGLVAHGVKVVGIDQFGTNGAPRSRAPARSAAPASGNRRRVSVLSSRGTNI